MNATTIDPKVLRDAQLVMLKILKEFDRICRENNIPYWLDSGTLLGAVRHQGFIPWDDDVDICMLRNDYNKFLEIAPGLLSSELFLQNFHTDRYFFHNYSKIRDKNSLFVEESERNVQVSYQQGIFIDIFPMDKLSTKSGIRYFWRNFVLKKIYTVCGTIPRYTQRSLKHPFYSHLLRNLRTIIIGKLFGKFNFPNLRTAASIEKLLYRLATIQSSETEKYVFGYGLELPFSQVYTYDTIFPLKQLIFEEATFFVPNDCDQYLRNLYGDTYMQPPQDEEQKIPHAALIITALNIPPK